MNKYKTKNKRESKSKLKSKLKFKKRFLGPFVLRHFPRGGKFQKLVV